MGEIQFFKDVLNLEIKRITQLCEYWENISTETISEEIQGRILSVIGQSRLLISAKLKQFRELINSCNSNQDNNGCKITIDDLRGFWDLVNIQIEDVNRKFSDLHLLQSNKWENPEVSISTGQNMSSKFKRQNSYDKIHSDAAKTRLAAAKEKLQSKMTKECCKNNEFYIY